jgi:uncharacterized protein
MAHKHIPQRTCVGCRQVRDKRTLIRVLRSALGEIEIDETGKQAGRGAYLCRDRICWQAALKGRRLDAALRVRLTQEEMSRLEDYAGKLPIAGDREG